jgi:hypothetical protein
MQNEQKQNTEQTNINQNWLEQEQKEMEQAATFDGEQLPALKLEDKKVTEIEIDFSKPFEKWISPEGIIKKIIPVIHNGERKVFWINTKNPAYREIINRGRLGQKKIRILRTGQQQNTRYNLVD